MGSLKKKKTHLKRSFEYALEPETLLEFPELRDITFQNKENFPMPSESKSHFSGRTSIEKKQTKSLFQQLNILSSAFSKAQKRIIDLEEKLNDRSEIIMDKAEVGTPKTARKNRIIRALYNANMKLF